MSEVVFILGAGASAGCGAPVMGDFLDKALSLQLARRLSENDDKAFRIVFDTIGTLQSVHSKAQLDLTNIESVFTALELARTIQVEMFSRNDLEVAIASLKILIVRTLEQLIGFPVAGDHAQPGAPEIYRKFTNLLVDLSKGDPPRTVSVITFNYDVALDIALGERDLGPNYALDLNVESGFWIDLLKLHGSLNWASMPDPDSTSRKLIIPLLWQQYTAKYNLNLPAGKTPLDISSRVQHYFKTEGKNIDAEPVIVPPTWNKADHYAMLRNVWARAARHLSEARYIFVIGYSLPETDAFFRHLYALGSVGKNPLLMFRVYDPQDRNGPVDKRFRALLGPGAAGRFKYESMTFIGAIDSIRERFGLESP